jgi:predicted DNA-binding protein with PD1-like motif
VRDAEIGYLDADGAYQTVVHEDAMELLSTEGNLAPGPDGPFTHIHVVLSDDGHVVHGGHLIRATVAMTAEIHLRDLSGADGVPFEREATGSQFLRLSFCDIE